MEYYHVGESEIEMNLAGMKQVRKIHIGNSEDYRWHRVKVIKAPVGEDETPLITHRFIYEADDHVKKKKEYDYDLNGNLIRKTQESTITHYDYDALNRLIAVRSEFSERSDLKFLILSKNLTIFF